MPTPPVGYGGIERVVHTLGECLVRLGHEVTLFAIPGSSFSGRLVEVGRYHCAQVPGGKPVAISEEALYEEMAGHLRQHPVDVIHDWSFQNLFATRHPEEFPTVISTCIPPPPGYRPANLVACSRAHARVFQPEARFIHYGLDLSQWRPQYEPREEFVHIAKVDRIKGQHLSIWAARRARARLAVAGGVTDWGYHRLVLQPLGLLHGRVRFLGEVRGTAALLTEAAASVQTPRWFEAFPLVNLESLACGTPLIALARGGLPEQVVHGVNGFLCASTAEVAAAMTRVGEISRRDCRAHAEAHFSVERMAAQYLECYRDAMRGERW